MQYMYDLLLTPFPEDDGNQALFSIIWSVSSPISTLIFGRLSDRFGRRYFVIGAIIIGLIGSE